MYLVRVILLKALLASFMVTSIHRMLLYLFLVILECFCLEYFKSRRARISDKVASGLWAKSYLRQHGHKVKTAATRTRETKRRN